MIDAIVLRREFATIVIPDSQKMLDRIKFDMEDARDIDVCSEAMAIEAQELIGRIASVSDDLDKERLATTLPLRDGAAWVNDGYKPTIDSLKTVIDGVKEKLKGWNKVVAKRKADAEDAERKLRKAQADELERKAAEQRAQADKLAAEAKKALAAGDTSAYADLFEQAAVADEQARTNTDVAAAVHAAPVRVATQVSGVKGARTVWKVRVTDKARFLIVVANRPEFHSLVEFSEVQLNALAKMNQGNVPVPGLEFYEEDIIATRRK